MKKQNYPGGTIGPVLAFNPSNVAYVEAANRPTFRKPRVGSSTPWGTAQGVDEVIPGMWWVSTASHGGVRLSPARQAAIPAALLQLGSLADQRAAGWYEEDCDWAIPYVAFAKEIPGQQTDIHKNAKNTLRNWHPDAYEAYFAEVIPPGKSYLKDERQFYAEHATDWLVLAAWGEWHENVPDGFVGVAASIGGKRQEYGSPPPEERYFLVPANAYQERGQFAFVIDPARHEIWSGPDAKK